MNDRANRVLGEEPRNLGIVEITPQAIADLLLLRNGDTLSVFEECEVPEGARLRGIHYNADKDSFLFMFEHPDLPALAYTGSPVTRFPGPSLTVTKGDT